MKINYLLGALWTCLGIFSLVRADNDRFNGLTEQKVDSSRHNTDHDACAREKRARRAYNRPPIVVRDNSEVVAETQPYVGRCTVLCGCGGTELVHDCLAAGAAVPVIGYLASLFALIQRTILG